MKASLVASCFSGAVILVACSGNDISIGMNDSGKGDGGSDASMGSDGQPNDSGNGGDGGNGMDSGIDSGADSGMCVPKVYSIQCGNGACTAEANFCFWVKQVPACTPTPAECKCNYTCACILAHLPANNCSTMPSCQGGNGGVSVSCY